MQITITPRKTTDRGGYLMMPLKENIPDPKNMSWKLTTCPSCGCECCGRTLPEGYTEDMFIGRLCTRCVSMVVNRKRGSYHGKG